MRAPARLLLAALAATSIASMPASAQKSKDELRIGINDFVSALDPVVLPHAEAATFGRTVYDPIIAYVERDKKFVGVVAKSFTVVEPGVYEFEIRDDLTFHSGNQLTPDDVLYTLNFFADPKIKIRFKIRYDWFKSVEKIGPNRIRIVAKQAEAADLATLAAWTRVYDSKVHRALDKYQDYGRVSASGTGPYRLASMDRSRVVIEKFAGFKGLHQRQPVGRYIGIGMPDEQTQVAQILTGGVDALRNVSTDNTRNLATNPNLRVFDVEPSGDLVYVTLDAAGRSKNKAMTDVRVRRAVLMALDRDTLIKEIVPGRGVAEKTMAICFKWWVDCRYEVLPPDHDPAEAKRLLTEAGYPNGFDLVIDVHEPIRTIAEAAAGELRKVGIRATVNPMPLPVYVKRRGDGEFTMFFGFYPTSPQPDMPNLTDFFIGADRDYYQDPILHETLKLGSVTFDLEQRAKIFQRVVDRVNEMTYIIPFSSLPSAYITTKDVKIIPDVYSYTSVYANDIVWSDYQGK